MTDGFEIPPSLSVKGNETIAKEILSRIWGKKGVFTCTVGNTLTSTIDSIVSTTMEILMMVPLAILFILFFRMGDNGMASVDFTRQMLIMGSGVVTAVPMLFYAVGVRNLPMMTTGICQYLSPTIGIFCSMIMGEMLTRDKLVSFYFIWAGVILYVLNMFYEERKKKHQTA